MADHEFKYWAFLSYCSEDNVAQRRDTPAAGRRSWGDWLYAALNDFSIPPEFISQINGRGEIIPERIEPIFRNELELPEAASLSAELRQALEQSRCLVVVCSPRSAQSRSVNEAVRYFKQLGRGQHIFPIVVAGEPHVSNGHPPGTTPADECFVPALCHPVRPDGTLDTSRSAGKHIYVDARHGAGQREILAHDHRQAEADLAMAKIQLIALVIGVGFNGLWWREQQRHFFDLAEAQQQAREALNQVEEVRRQLGEADRQTRAAQTQLLERQNLSPDVQGQIQAAQDQALAAQQQAREARQQFQEFQNQVRETQAQLEEARSRARAAESKVLATQLSAQEIQKQLEATRIQARAAQNQALEIQNQTQADQLQNAQNQISKAQRQAQEAHSQLEATRQQVQDAQNKLLAAQSQVQEFQCQARAAQSQLTEARQQVDEAQGQILAAQHQTREAQNQVQQTQNLSRDVHGEINVAPTQVQTFPDQDRKARRFTKLFAVLAALALLAAGVVARNAWRQRQIDRQSLAKAASEASGTFELTAGGESIPQVLEKIGGAEQAENRRHSLDHLAAEIPPNEITEVLQAAAAIVDDEERSHFQKWLLLRLGWANPGSAMTNAGAIAGKIVNDDGRDDSALFFQLAVLDNWMQTDWPGAFRWVCQLPDAASRQRALDKMILWTKSQPDSATRNQALIDCIDDVAKTDVPGALDLAKSLPDGVQRDPVIVWIWMGAGPFAVSDLSNGLALPPEIMTPRNVSWPWTKLAPSDYWR
jgi:uncharacterized coiled-coil DUF342 family protein